MDLLFKDFSHRVSFSLGGKRPTIYKRLLYKLNSTVFSPFVRCAGEILLYVSTRTHYSVHSQTRSVPKSSLLKFYDTRKQELFIHTDCCLTGKNKD